MTAPIAARDVAAAAGALLVLSTVVSVVGTVIVPRKSGSRLTRLVASGVNGIFGLIVRPVDSPQADAVNRQSRVTAQVGQQLADARVPGLACLGGVHR